LARACLGRYSSGKGWLNRLAMLATVVCLAEAKACPSHIHALCQGHSVLLDAVEPVHCHCYTQHKTIRSLRLVCCPVKSNKQKNKLVKREDKGAFKTRREQNCFVNADEMRNKINEDLPIVAGSGIV
jgi:hypothetical protein